MKLHISLHAYMALFPRQRLPHAITVWAEAAKAVVLPGEDLNRLSHIDILDLTRRAAANFQSEARAIGAAGTALLAHSCIDNDGDAKSLAISFCMVEDTVSYIEANPTQTEGD